MVLSKRARRRSGCDSYRETNVHYSHGGVKHSTLIYLIVTRLAGRSHGRNMATLLADLVCGRKMGLDEFLELTATTSRIVAVGHEQGPTPAPVPRWCP
jgi:hypothetical protein